jgi:hypothetical protein
MRSIAPIAGLDGGILVAVDVAEAAEALPTTDATQIESAIAALPALFRETVVLRDILGLSYRAIAEVTGAPTGAVAWRLAEGRRELLMTEATVAPDPADGPPARYDDFRAIAAPETAHIEGGAAVTRFKQRIPARGINGRNARSVAQDATATEHRDGRSKRSTRPARISSGG